MKMNQKKLVFIIGCSNMGAYIAGEMSNLNYDVSVVDKDEEAFKKIHGDFSGFKRQGDGTNIDFLQEIGIKDATIALVVTDNDNVNSYISQYLDKILNVPLVIARIYDKEKQFLLRNTQVKMIFPSELTSKEFFNIVIQRDKEEENK